jgi:phage terminase small subunit
VAGDKLNPKQQRFVEEYLKDLNATQAAIRAGYKPSRAEQTGCDLVRNRKVANAIQKAKDARSDRTKVDQDRVVKEFSRIAFLDPRKVMGWGPTGVTFHPSEGLTEDEAAVVSEASQTVGRAGVTMKLKLASKLDALDKLARHLGIYKDKLEVSGPNGAPLVTEIVIEHHKATHSPEGEPPAGEN